MVGGGRMGGGEEGGRNERRMSDDAARASSFGTLGCRGGGVGKDREGGRLGRSRYLKRKGEEGQNRLVVEGVTLENVDSMHKVFTHPAPHTCSIQCSISCEGSSTKSRRTLVPEGGEGEGGGGWGGHRGGSELDVNA